MEFTVEVAELRRALQRSQGIVERKGTMPILAHVLLTAGKSTIQVTAFDLDTGIVSEHPAQIVKSGTGTVSAKTLLDIVNLAPDARVTLKSLPNNYLEISSGLADYKIVGMAGEDFPKLVRESTAPLVKFPAVVLSEFIKKTSYAIASDESRPALNGVLFDSPSPGIARMVSTDGHRLAMVERAFATDFKLKGSVVIPRKGLLEMKRILDEDPKAECEIGFADNAALFKKAGLTMVVRLIDANFPDYQRVIPKAVENKLVVDRSNFSDALKRISLLSLEKSSAVKLTLSENQLRVAATNPELGEAKDDLAVTYNGPTMSVGFNARYFLDVLGAMDTAEVSVELGEEHGPAVLHPVGSADAFTAVIMPMRV